MVVVFMPETLLFTIGMSCTAIGPGNPLGVGRLTLSLIE